MKNTMDFNNTNMQAATVAVMNDILASDMTGSSMDDVYSAVCKYANVSREKFDELYQNADQKLTSWKNGGCELDEDDLDMVVGGSLGSFFQTVLDGVVSGASAVGNFVKENAAQIGMVAAALLCATGFGAGVGALVAASCMASVGVGALVGGGVGLVAGIACLCAPDKSKEC